MKIKKNSYFYERSIQKKDKSGGVNKKQAKFRPSIVFLVKERGKRKCIGINKKDHLFDDPDGFNDGYF